MAMLLNPFFCQSPDALCGVGMQELPADVNPPPQHMKNKLTPQNETVQPEQLTLNINDRDSLILHFDHVWLHRAANLPVANCV